MPGQQDDRPSLGRSSRRRFLGGLGTAAVVGLAGCNDLVGRTYDRRQDDYDPEIPPDDETYPGGDITMFRRGSRRLGYYPGVTVPETVEKTWSHPTNYIGHSAAKASPRPTPDGETILVPADTGHVHAFTPMGKHRWTVQTGATSLGIHGTPTIVDDVAYLGGYDGDLYAFDTATGETVWRTPRSDLDGAIAIGSSPAYWDGIVYVIAEYKNPDTGTMWAIDADSGEPLWSDDRPHGMPHPSTAIDPATERMVSGSNDGVVYAWEFPSLEFEWSFETGDHVKGTIPTYDGGAFVGSWDGHFYRLNLVDGTEEWSFDTGEIIMSNPGINPEDGVVYVGSDDEHVYALDAATGDVLWSRDVGGHVIGSLTVTADAVLVGSYDTHLYALERATGEVRWRVENRGHVTSEPVPHDGRIYYAERARIRNWWNDEKEAVLQEPGHAYCLESAE